MTDDISIADRIEALLFAEGGTLSNKKLAQLLELSDAALEQGLTELARKRKGSGIELVRTDTESALAISPAAAGTIQKAFEKEIGREIGDAGLEVLAIILYRGPSTRSQIDYIRGVNTSSTIRTLAARGLVERIQNPNDAREYLYRATAELLAYLGASEKTELPDYGKITSELAAFEAQHKSPFDNDHAESGDSKPE